MPSGRPNPLANPEFAKAVAEAFVAGESRKSMCEMFNVKDPGTITSWRRDPRVQNIALKLTKDRVLQVTRKVDAKIAGKLEMCDDLTVNELLAIRKEFLGGVLRDQTEQIDEQTMSEAQDLLEQDPTFVDDLQRLIAETARKES